MLTITLLLYEIYKISHIFTNILWPLHSLVALPHNLVSVVRYLQPGE